MRKARILIVEDESFTAEWMRMMLAEAGYDMSHAVATGEEAVRIIPEILPDLILMDIQLGGTIDGVTACEQIRKSRDIPVVFVSTYTDKDMVSRSIRAEPSGFLAKPFTKEQLIKKVETALAWHSLRAEK